MGGHRDLNLALLVLDGLRDLDTQRFEVCLSAWS